MLNSWQLHETLPCGVWLFFFCKSRIGLPSFSRMLCDLSIQPTTLGHSLILLKLIINFHYFCICAIYCLLFLYCIIWERFAFWLFFFFFFFFFTVSWQFRVCELFKVVMPEIKAVPNKQTTKHCSACAIYFLDLSYCLSDSIT